MVKRIVDYVILGLLLVRLLTLQWPSDLAGIISMISTVIISVAAGLAISNLLARKGDDDNG